VLYIVDGLNIMKSRNHDTWGSGDVSLEWPQLESLCRYYVSRQCEVSVYLPPLRPGHEAQVAMLRRQFGDIFTICRSTSDDKFMINTAKLYQSEREMENPAGAADGVAGVRPHCYIVTNDKFEDWKRRGDVDTAWTERHCIRFAFGPGGCFVPSELV